MRGQEITSQLIKITMLEQQRLRKVTKILFELLRKLHHHDGISAKFLERIDRMNPAFGNSYQVREGAGKITNGSFAQRRCRSWPVSLIGLPHGSLFRRRNQ